MSSDLYTENWTTHVGHKFKRYREGENKYARRDKLGEEMQ